MNVVLNEPSTFLTSLLSVRMHANFVALGPIPIAVAVPKSNFSKLLNSVRFRRGSLRDGRNYPF